MYQTEKIRLATSNDFEIIFQIWENGIKTTFSDYDHPVNLKELFQKNFSNRNNYFNFWVIEQDNEIIGWCSILPIFSNPIKRQLNGEVSTYIREDFFANKIGQTLMKYVFEEIQKSPVKAIYGFANKDNEGSIQMCLKAGMSICGTTSFKTILIREFE